MRVGSGSFTRVQLDWVLMKCSTGVVGRDRTGTPRTKWGGGRYPVRVPGGTLWLRERPGLPSNVYRSAAFPTIRRTSPCSPPGPSGSTDLDSWGPDFK